MDLKAKFKNLDKDQQKVLWSALIVISITFMLAPLFEDPYNMWALVLLLQFAITKFIFSGKVEKNKDFILDKNSGKKIQIKTWHSAIPFIFIIFTIISVNIGGAIRMEYGYGLTLVQLFFTLLPFIVTRSYIFFKKLPLSSLYIFTNFKYRPATYTLNSTTTPECGGGKIADDWKYFSGNHSSFRR